MTYTVFTTPGELDMSALTTFGMNVKPSTTSPIGFFGTGLKYAIAVLMRLGIPVTIYTGGVEYKFYTKEYRFRGKDFLTCRYRKTGLLNKWSYHELPFTTELGKHWELWQAFRELMSNTIDEAGSLITSEHFLEELGVADQMPKYTDIKQTWIVVEGDAFAEVVAKKDDIFLPKDKLKLVAANKDVEVYEGNSRYIYYRGLRAYDLKAHEKETIYTYNYIGSQAQLTEDRSIKYIWYVQDAVIEVVTKSDNRKFIGTMMKPADRYWEKNLDYSTIYGKSDTFNSVVYRMGSSTRAAAYMPASARTYYTDVLRDAPKGSKGLQVSDEIWEAIVNTLTEIEDNEGLTALEELFGRGFEPITETKVEGIPENLPPGTYKAKITDVVIEGNKMTTKVEFDDDIPF